MNDTELDESDPLAPARGCVWGMIFAAALWAVAIVAAVMYYGMRYWV